MSETCVPIYLDNNSTTRADPSVVQAMLPFFAERFGNASSSHDLGSEAASAVNQARRSLQQLLGNAHEHEIAFTSGGTEANNTAILSALATQDGRDEIVTTSVEHSAILALVEQLATRGVKTHVIPVDSCGRIDIEAFRRAVGPRTAIASVMWANNETGTIFPVEFLAGLAREAGALFHCDAVQAVGKVRIDLKDSAIDMLSLSAHKLHGPKGIGALYLRKGTKFKPLIWGGSQERRRRGGTENVPGIVGLGKAAELAAERLEPERVRIGALRDRLEQAILHGGDCTVLGDVGNRLSNTADIAFEHLDGEAIVHHLNRAGIAASLGAACNSGSMEPSHVLRAMRVPATSLRGAVRFSLSRETTVEDVDQVVSVLSDIVAQLRAMPRACANPASDTASFRRLTS
ncbi:MULTISPECIES: cysteine desulfurase NifS [unclassified Bradyrhizobium]|uniref:cysteine desulfurase NifS n=1 Tax=unclassified Bradyrhizobium TaxID=2631580 RepID=UPI002479AB76|nr:MULTISPECIES: cysteine desulfurase NifS [unclassified Bradyrhizobium]WGR93596.1 cysteine desulfurase NifS [Bradyrhizobium sp. ISRA435]WGR98157.1 cysteine desulfurase NifS [Bradyrhizobium sp. ISRA436]WGS05046.1 cysteine desulfurase NifS [Bradyrhizobium sp. ISRA437]WGS11931.1 cysteine desulfurase NifS [Bradyrhizobium sp. ISRA443]WGS19390.1 cysteine desulfurase NifS [Bradyrhizobium sp. ISRA463]